MDGSRNVTWLLCFRCTGSFGLTASVKGTPAARRGRKATALDSQEEQEGWAAGTNRPHQVLQRQPVGSFSVEGTPLSRLPAHGKRRKFAGGFMSKKPFLTLLSTAALSAVAAMSVPVSAVVAAPGAASKAEAPKFNNKLYIVRLAELPVVAYTGGIKGLQATKPQARPEDRPEQPGRRRLQGLPRIAPEHSARWRRRHGESPQLRLHVQWVLRRTVRGASCQAAGDSRRGVGHQGQPSAARDGHDSSLPRLDGRRRLLRQDRREGRGRHHRHRRQRRLARASRATRIARAPTATARRTASWLTSRSPAGMAGAPRASTSTPPTATRS